MSDSNIDGEASDQATLLCTQCGICCDGSIFNCVNLVPEDGKVVAPLRSFSGKGEGDLLLKLPCAALDSSRKCGVYPNRPQICRSFRCALLRKLDTGAVSFENAKEKVAVALDQRAKTLKIVNQFVAVEDRDLRAIHREYLELGNNPDVNKLRAYKEGQLLLNALRRYLRQNFHPNSKVVKDE